MEKQTRAVDQINLEWPNNMQAYKCIQRLTVDSMLFKGTLRCLAGHIHYGSTVSSLHHSFSYILQQERNLLRIHSQYKLVELQRESIY